MHVFSVFTALIISLILSGRYYVFPVTFGCVAWFTTSHISVYVFILFYEHFLSVIRGSNCYGNTFLSSAPVRGEVAFLQKRTLKQVIFFKSNISVLFDLVQITVVIFDSI